jgi:phosphate starvation-inducible PhoH-like protein
MAEKIIHIEDETQLSALFGQLDSNIHHIEKNYNVSIINRDGLIKIIGEETAVADAEKSVNALIKLNNNGQVLSDQTIRYVTSVVADGAEQQLEDLGKDGVCVTSSGKIIRPRTIGQKNYIDEIKNNTIVLGIGPAGTGKTYLAVAMAVKAFREHKIKKIILTRPAVEAGEKLGFLPGDMQDKVDPYLRPLYDALFDMFGGESFSRYMEKGIIEVAPLAYMRGRTLDEAFIILDEAQNTTSEQIKMFLTRLGNESRMVITGDITQIDLPDPKKSGLVEAVKILKGIDDIGIHRFSEKDVVRHKLVQDIIKAYEKFNEGRKNHA